MTDPSAKFNPYQAPSTQVAPYPPVRENGKVPLSTVLEIHRTAGWMRFLAILGLLLGGLALVPAVLFLLRGRELPNSTKLPAIEFLCLIALTILFHLAASLWLHRTASAATRLTRTPTETNLLNFAKRNHFFWILVSILSVLNLAYAVSLGL